MFVLDRVDERMLGDVYGELSLKVCLFLVRGLCGVRGDCVEYHLLSNCIMALLHCKINNSWPVIET